MAFQTQQKIQLEIRLFYFYFFLIYALNNFIALDYTLKRLDILRKNMHRYIKHVQRKSYMNKLK